MTTKHKTEDYKIIENSFFNLYTYTEYFIDIYNNYTHYILYLF